MSSATTTALAIPEVLSCILAFLDTTFIRTNVLFVCKSWYFLVRRLHQTQHHWLGKIPLTNKSLLHTLGNIHVLPVISRTSTYYHIRASFTPSGSNRTKPTINHAMQWTQLYKSVANLSPDDQEHFQKLVVRAPLELWPTLELAQQFQVTTLRIENSWLETIALDQILLACTHLEDLDIDSVLGQRTATCLAASTKTTRTRTTTIITTTTSQQELAGCPGAVAESYLAALPSLASSKRPDSSVLLPASPAAASLSTRMVLSTSIPELNTAPFSLAPSQLGGGEKEGSFPKTSSVTSLKLKLKRLSLNRVSVSSVVLGTLLAQCPNLVEFRVIHGTIPVVAAAAAGSAAIAPGAGELTTVITAATCSKDTDTRSTILNLLQKHCPKLNAIHFSLLDSRPTEQEQIQMFQQLRTVQSWSIAHSDLLPTTFDSLRQYATHLTSLEVCCSCNSIAPETLHRYLCQATRLQHLSIENMVYPVEYLEIGRSSSWTAQEGEDVQSTGTKNQVWACRNLRSLQIKLGSLGENDTRAAKRSRRVFAYISQVCPRLQQLHIIRSLMNVQLEGGLCYLTGLEELERLTLQTTHFQSKHISDFGWINAGTGGCAGTAPHAHLPLSTSTTVSSVLSATSENSVHGVNRKTLVRLTSRLSRAARRQSRSMFGDLLSRVSSMRSRSVSPDPAMEEKPILKRIAQMESEETIKTTMSRLTKRSDSDTVWPVLETVVLDAVKYSGVSKESMEALVAEARPGLVFRTF
ncbi:hypothetical protein BG004_004974 [Podila humilis]|nr:hypothetical protein BG004_004974 [Podila humilis]